jgi:N-acetylglucosaminylphosphatidylinositol deacetylase
MGETRKKELLGSCEALGIDTSRCVALDNPDLQDNPKVWWEEAKIKPILKEYIEKWNIDAVSSWPVPAHAHPPRQETDTTNSDHHV